MAKKGTRKAKAAQPEPQSEPTPKAESQKPKAPARTIGGKLTEEMFAAARATIGCKNNEEAAEAIGLSRAYGKILSARPGVKDLIAANRAWQVDMLKLNSVRVLTETWYLGRSDISEVATRKDGKLVLLDDDKVPFYANKAIRKITNKVEERLERLSQEEIAAGMEPAVIIKSETSIEMHDKAGPLNLVAKHLGILEKEKDRGDKMDLADAYYLACQEVVEDTPEQPE